MTRKFQKQISAFIAAALVAQSAPPFARAGELSAQQLDQINSTILRQPFIISRLVDAADPALIKAKTGEIFKRAGVGFLQSIMVLVVLSAADQLKQKMRQRHINPDGVAMGRAAVNKRELDKMSKEAVQELLDHRHTLYRCMDKFVDQPVSLIVGAGVRVAADKLLNKTDFQVFLASALPGLVFTFGLDLVSEIMRFAAQAVADKAATYHLNDREKLMLKTLVDPTNYSTSYFIAGTWSKDRDKRTVHSLIFTELFGSLLKQPSFVNAFLSHWVRGNMTGDNAVRIGSMMLNVWLYAEISAAVGLTAGATAGTAVEPGGGTVVGGTAGLATGFAIGLPLSIMVGLVASRVPQPSKDALTFVLHSATTEIWKIRNFAVLDAITEYNWVTSPNLSEAALRSVYMEAELRQNQRETAVLHALDLLQIVADRVESLEADLYLATTRKNMLKQEGTWSAVKDQLKSLALGATLGMALIESNPDLEQIIQTDKELIHYYQLAFEHVAGSVNSLLDKDMALYARLQKQYQNPGLTSYLNTENKKLQWLKSYFHVLFGQIYSGMSSAELNPVYMRARQSLERITFWNQEEQRLMNAISSVVQAH